MGRIEQLEDRIAELEELLGAKPRFSMKRLLGPVNWPKACDPFLGLLLARDLVTREAAFTVIYGGRPESEQPEPKIIDVFMSRIRIALRPHGVTIDTVWALGFSMTPQNKARLRALIEQLTAAPVPVPERVAAPRRSHKQIVEHIRSAGPQTAKRKLDALERRRAWMRERET